MTIEIISLGYTKPPVGCPPKRWHEIFMPYHRTARAHAANLASHNWDVLLIGGRLFFYQTKYGGDLGHWLTEEGAREDATADQMKALYERSPGGEVRRIFRLAALETEVDNRHGE